MVVEDREEAGVTRLSAVLALIASVRRCGPGAADPTWRIDYTDPLARESGIEWTIRPIAASPEEAVRVLVESFALGALAQDLPRPRIDLRRLWTTEDVAWGAVPLPEGLPAWVTERIALHLDTTPPAA